MTSSQPVPKQWLQNLELVDFKNLAKKTQLLKKFELLDEGGF